MMRSESLQSKARWVANKSVTDLHIDRGVALLICKENMLQLYAKWHAVVADAI